ncbi:MAG: bifunctional UDP-N-acetylglucosamine diphosphorylase/glucosamine-1-phosphate N-acetyltransferase GlmU [Chloroflexi bacterium]|nr:bifunctional UDP-N-acetylglucosamine diphosphorylase/glucosamine-1-phosphate N-acetyltransferase GlmU [Chloroflexota bacterium]
MATWAAVVLAAGKGVRMNSALPKVLHRVCGREMVRHVVEAVRAVHQGPVVIVVSPDSQAVRQCLGDSVEYVEQPEPRGTGDAVARAERLLVDRAQHLLVLYGDTPLLTSSTLSRLMEWHEATGAVLTLVTFDGVAPKGLGRIVRDAEGQVVAVVEEAEARGKQKAITEVNGGVYGFQAEWLWPALGGLAPSSTGELYLTALVASASREGLPVESVSCQEPGELLGVNNRVQLAQAEQAMRQRVLERWMLAGVTITDPASTYVDEGVVLGRDTVIFPNTTVAGATRVGERCHLGPGAMVFDSTIGDDCKVVASMVEGAVLEEAVHVGPFAHLRPGAYLEREVHVGNYAEVKNSRIGRGTKMGHFSYVGDAEVGRDVNIGAGTITCNYDGVRHHRTVIGDGAFIGSDTMLVAPVRVGAGASTGAGAVVTRDVPPDSLAVGMPARPRAKGRPRERGQPRVGK